MGRAKLVVLAGSLLAVLVPVTWVATGSGDEPEQFGAVVAQDLRTAPAAAAPSTVATSSARLVDLVDETGPPVEVSVAGVSAPVDPVGLDDVRQVVIPDDVRRAGWYSPGVQPGDETGSAVLVGHVDDREQGLGAFAVLRDVQPGAEVTVRTASGEALVYDVVALEQFDKSEVPLERLFAVDGDHRLVLISCGGDFDSASGSYTDNVVVTAVPRA